MKSLSPVKTDFVKIVEFEIILLWVCIWRQILGCEFAKRWIFISCNSFPARNLEESVYANLNELTLGMVTAENVCGMLAC